MSSKLTRVQIIAALRALEAECARSGIHIRTRYFVEEIVAGLKGGEGEEAE